MDASILVVGDSDFCAALLESIHALDTLTVETSPNPAEASPLIQAQQPDLLIMQSSQPGSLALCQQVKEQSRLAWIYCILLDDVSLSPDQLYKPQATEAKIVALESGADVYGWISLYSPEGDALKHKTVKTALQDRLLQAHIRTGLRRVQNHRELMRTNDLLSAIALSDPLTELNNRRAFEWELPRQINNARMREMPLSLLMLDVDFFKAINDSYGHLVGDRALKLLSARLRHNLRFYDTPFRYGGEEFVIILGDTAYQETLMIAERLCRLIGDQPFTVNDTLELMITISAGAACLIPEDDPKGTSFLQRADQNLLAAKAQGRNRVVGCQELKFL